jgi:hypothetical protein
LPTIALSGTGATIGLAPDALDFGGVPCGLDAGPQGFQLGNAGSAPMTFSAQLQNGTAYALSCDTGTETNSVWSGTLGPSTAAQFVVTPFPVPQTSAVTPDLYGDVVMITTSNTTSPVGVPLAETAMGAILTFVPPALSFGNVPVDTTTAPQNFQVQNSGNTSAGFFLSSPNAAFALYTPSGPLLPSTDTPLAAGTAQTLGATFSPGGDISPQSSTLTFAVDATTNLCAPLPGPDGGVPSLELFGQGTNGQVAFSPSTLAFGLVDCGTQAAAQAVTFNNNGNEAYTLTALLDAGTAYTLAVAPAGGMVAAGGTATVTLTPKPIPQTSAIPGPYDDWLTVNTTAIASDGGLVSVLIPVTESAQGAVLAGFAPNNGQIAFGNTPIGGQSSFQLYIQNTGNQAAPLDANAGPPQFDIPSITVPANGNTGSNWNATFTPQKAQLYQASGTIGFDGDAGAVLCQPLPAILSSLALSGTGTNAPTFSANPLLVLFGTVNCGSAPPASQNVTLTNSGLTAVSWTAALSASSGGPDGGPLFSIAPTSGSVPAGGTQPITVTPAPLTTALGKTGQVGVTLTISYGSSGSTIQVTIGETAQGAVLSWNPGNLKFLTCRNPGTTDPDVLQNVPGNVAVTVNLQVVGDPNSELTFTTLSPTAPAGGTITDNITCSDTVLAPVEIVTVTTLVPNGTPLCAPAPGPFTITTP